jgi:hypothetical protein
METNFHGFEFGFDRNSVKCAGSHIIYDYIIRRVLNIRLPVTDTVYFIQYLNPFGRMDGRMENIRIVFIPITARRRPIIAIRAPYCTLQLAGHPAHHAAACVGTPVETTQLLKVAKKHGVVGDVSKRCL